MIMAKSKKLDILFIGNSHTFCNDMPWMVKRIAEDDGFECNVIMIAHSGWYLEQHADEPDVRFNIKYGNYDYVVLQEHAHPFGPESRFRDAAVSLNRMIREAGSIPVIFETWAAKGEPEKQAEMNEVHERIAAEIGALIAPVGKEANRCLSSRPDFEFYAGDGGHASWEGSTFAAKIIWDTIRSDFTESMG